MKSISKFLFSCSELPSQEENTLASLSVYMFARREKLLRNISSNKCDISQREGKLIRNLVCHRAASINQLFPRPASRLVICTRDNHNNNCAKLVGAPTGEIISFHNIVKVFSLKFPHLSLSRKNVQLFIIIVTSLVLLVQFFHQIMWEMC